MNEPQTTYTDAKKLDVAYKHAAYTAFYNNCCLVDKLISNGCILFICAAIAVRLLATNKETIILCLISILIYTITLILFMFMQHTNKQYTIGLTQDADVTGLGKDLKLYDAFIYCGFSVGSLVLFVALTGEI